MWVLSCLLIASIKITFISNLEWKGWEKIPEVANTSQCIYSPENNILSCRGQNKIVECSVAYENSNKKITFDVFGISKPLDFNKTESKEYKFNLFPRRIENSTRYFDNIHLDNDKNIKMVLYSSTSFTDIGFRVEDQECFRSLVDLFMKTNENHEAELENGKTIMLFGEILIAEKPSHKKWLGWGLGLGSGWGWGFPGWGLPLWGLAWGK